MGRELTAADPKTFKCWTLYAADKSSIWCEGKLLSESSPRKFRVFALDHRYAKNSNCIFWSGQKIVGVDQKNFRPMGMGYARDSRNAYFGRNALDDIHLSSFEVGNSFGKAKDRFRTYYHGKPTN